MEKKFSYQEYDNNIYHDAARYDDEHWWKKDDLEFWVNTFTSHGKPNVLELAAGTGRIAEELLKVGADFTGIEISQEFCDRADEKLGHYGDLYRMHQGDIRNFDLKRKFGLIYIGFNSFLHLLKDQDASACLECVKNHLTDDGIFMIDIFIPNPLFLYRPEGIRYPTMEYRESDSNRLITVEETNLYDPETEINNITWFYEADDGAEDIYEFTMRMFWPDTMNRLLIDAGFKILDIWGDYENNEMSEESNLQIYKCGLAIQ